MREMRRKDRQLDSADTLEILKNGEYGVLATVTEDGSPYGVPMSYAFDEESHVIYEAKQQSTTSIGAAAPHDCG